MENMDDVEKLPAIGEYVLRSKLGERSLSTIWEAEHRNTNQVVALKQIQMRKLTRRLKNGLECELSFLSSVNHPNIIRLLDVLESAENSGMRPHTLNIFRDEDTELYIGPLPPAVVIEATVVTEAESANEAEHFEEQWTPPAIQEIRTDVYDASRDLIYELRNSNLKSYLFQ